MHHLPNLLSVSRIFLSLLLFSDQQSVRLLAIFLAGLTDFLDGFLARKLSWISKWGTTLDPIGDKFFVMIGLVCFILEGSVSVLEALLMLSRDFAIVLFAFYLLYKKSLKDYPIRAIFFGKVTTALQLGTFLLLACNMAIPFPVYVVFLCLGILALFELWYTFAFSTVLQKNSSK
ncbi:CDP-alcohol phosphatidyltransferase family protein [Estrella lausannensis]|uniref:CDP-diacylglycerol--glycerol-3-phosphate 3-phosphatidyltransferase n=1 Tax=Estrella lausannensis TaxID=483423 RepID=A0A0H5DRZ1_9BACT|nr:CDP-alcohol phosphatidyltransferase family protein [Estrella lausannensis]CRX39023.1 Putative CDP-diacylglycerol-glycerol-3-phosphate 3-phosphatidyltransferase [Estrella lausannensis]